MTKHDLSIVLGTLIERAPPEAEVKDLVENMVQGHPSRVVEWLLTVINNAENDPLVELNQQILTVKELLGAGCVGVSDEEFKQLLFSSVEMAFPQIFLDICSSEDKSRWIVEATQMLIGVVRKWSS